MLFISSATGPYNVDGGNRLSLVGLVGWLGRPDQARSDELPPPAEHFREHLAQKDPSPATREAEIDAAVETWRVLNGESLPFDTDTARRFVAESYDRESDHEAAAQHASAGIMTDDRKVPLSTITVPTLIIHGTDDPINPLPHGKALATQIPHAKLTVIEGMGHGFFSPGLPTLVADRILAGITDAKARTTDR